MYHNFGKLVFRHGSSAYELVTIPLRQNKYFLCSCLYRTSTNKSLRLGQTLYNSRYFPCGKNVVFFGRLAFSIAKCTSQTTHYCGAVRLEDVGKKVTVRGFLQYQRGGKFCILRDYYGLLQVIVKDEVHKSLLKSTTYESYIEVSGEVLARPKDQINKSMKTGEIEIAAETYVILNKAKKDLPFLIRDHNPPHETLGLKHRYLELRHPYLQENLRFRSKLSKKIRDVLQDDHHFVEITTPTLSIRTPGGAQEFVVPSQEKNSFYSLVQSPQIYKQMAIIGGFEKYFQFPVCYRDEGGRPDRQPEFMQLDIEMANVSCSDVRNLVEDILVRSWPEDCCNAAPTRPFPSLTYAQAMETYGVDKPDTRFQWKISDVSSIICGSNSSVLLSHLSQEGVVAKAFVIPQGEKFLKKKHTQDWVSFAQKEIGLPGVSTLVVRGGQVQGKAAEGIPCSSHEQLIDFMGAKDGDVIVLSVGPWSKVLKLLGKLRVRGADILESSGVEVRTPGVFEFVWVVDFPLFERDEATGQPVTCHHPFTAPHPDYHSLLTTKPEEVLSQHYDLVLNGHEIAGGSIRVHESETQKRILDILGIEPGTFGFLLEALDSGAPPHGGVALGFDRYVSILRGSRSVREVMAFPKTSEGRCLLTGAPAGLSDEDRKAYHLRS